jgi:hypothetical protein|tara:strand:- start:617 stop:2038 length:1422 start_codon:yes stop_codon:yes gene_type:complete
MAAVVNTFLYSGTLRQVVIPAGTQSIDVHLWGGAGGGGGSDAGGPGGTGAAGHHVSATTISMTSNIGKTLTVAVGGGGAGGTSGGGAAGATNGKSIAGYSGGTGGNAGPQPYSGSGGGGGGATTVLVDGNEIATAGGGGGGAGAGKGSNGTAGVNTNTATSNSPGTLGENGASHSGDGGGGGAGGGGTDGGTGGNGGSGDNGGTGGKSGSNTAAGGTEANGSGVTPGGTSNAYYQSGVAVGGAGSNPGADGLAVVIFNISVEGKIKVGGAWKGITDAFFKAGGAWKRVTAGYVKIGGAWKALFNNGITFTSTAAGFGNASGGSTSGTGGSGGGCFIAGTMISMADGSLKPVEQVDIGDIVSVGGKVFATGKFLIDNLYDYNGIKVSGTHMVKEDGAWVRVEDSRIGRSLGDDEVIVYVFGNENRRIIINGTEFTDYFELSEQQELINHGEEIFSNWQDHDRQIHDKNVNILNA